MDTNRLFFLCGSVVVWFGRGIKKPPRFERGGQNDVAKLVLFGIIGLNGFRLDDDCGVATGERLALGGDGARHIARGESQSHGNSRGYSQCQVLNRLNKALFLSV